MEISNRKAYHEYFIEHKYTAGMVLMGTEVKSIRQGKLSFNDAYCIFYNNELFIKGLYIAEYNLGTSNNHATVYDRKLLLQKRELKKLAAAVKEKGVSLIPLRVFINEKHLFKLEIGLAKGKKNYDKRDTIKKRDVEREMKRYLK
jgi:SsrA-binding protein